MSGKRHTPEEIVTKLRQVEVLPAQGRPAAEAIRSIGVAEVLRDGLLDGEIFHSLQEARIVIGPRRSLGRATAPQRRPAPLGPRLQAARSRGAVAGATQTWPAPPVTPAVAPRPVMH
jgi:hypothetical protein